MERTAEQQRIDARLSIIKQWYQENYPICPFCGHRVLSGDLAHFVPRSFASKYYPREVIQTLINNVGLAHRDCHEMYDDHPDQAHYLPKILDVAYNVAIIEPDYFPIMFDRYNLSDILEANSSSISTKRRVSGLLNSSLLTDDGKPLVHEIAYGMPAHPHLAYVLAIHKHTTGKRALPAFPSAVRDGLLHDVASFCA
jgi:hypothetical protein